jgi:hypothetical protein
VADSRVYPFIALLDGEPIGYAQSYVALGAGDGGWEDETDPGVRGIDQLAGFVRVREIVTPDGPALLMTMPRPR